MKNTKRISICITTILMVLLLLSSCSEPQLKVDKNEKEEIIPQGVVEVGMVILEDKTLTSDLNRDIKYWEFMATPKFTLGEGEKIYGQVTYWRMLSELDTEADGVVKTSANLGRYTSGDWLFEVRALNSNKHVVAVGSTQQIVREGLDNIVEITALTDRADGTHGQSMDATSTETGWDGHDPNSKTTTIERTGSIHVGLLVNRLDSDTNKMRIVTKYQKVTKSAGLDAVATPGITWTVRNGATESRIDSTGAVIAQGTPGENYTKWYKTATPTNYKTVSGDDTSTVELGKVYYEGVLENMDAGPYIFTFYLQGKDKDDNWIDLGGQAVDVMIVGGEETQVKGTLLANEYVLAGLRITSPGTIYGTINGRNYIQGTPGTPVELTWNQTPTESADSGEAAVRYYWSVNGTEQTTTAASPTFTFNCPTDDDGNYLYGIYRVSCSPTGALGSIGNSTIDIIFNPTDGPNVGEFDWSGII